jgi:hypothetical protein
VPVTPSSPSPNRAAAASRSYAVAAPRAADLGIGVGFWKLHIREAFEMKSLPSESRLFLEKQEIVVILTDINGPRG